MLNSRPRFWKKTRMLIYAWIYLLTSLVGHFLNYLFVRPDTPWYKHNYLCRRWQVLKWYCLRNSQKAHKQILLLPYCMQAEGENMYCPVYGCNSDGQKNTSGIHFFSFPSGKSVSQQNRRKAWHVYLYFLTCFVLDISLTKMSWVIKLNYSQWTIHNEVFHLKFICFLRGVPL